MVEQAITPNGYHDAVEEGYSFFKAMAAGDGMAITPPAAATASDDHGNSYSAFMHKQAELTNYLYSVVLEGDIDEDDDEAKLLLLQLFRHFEREWTAEIANRAAYKELAEKRAAGYKARFGEEHLPDTDSAGNQLRDVDDLVHDWNRATSLLTEALVQKRLHGLAHVREALRREIPVFDEDGGPLLVGVLDQKGAYLLDDDGNIVRKPKVIVQTARQRLDLARAEVERVRYEVAELPPNHNQYFWARIEALQIDIDNNFDRQLGIPVRDYTDVKAQLVAGVRLHLLIDKMPWAYQELYARVRSSMSGKAWRDFLTTNQIQQWPYDRRPPKGRLGMMDKFRDFFGSGDDDDERPEEVEEDQKPRSRRDRRGAGRQNKGRNGRRR